MEPYILLPILILILGQILSKHHTTFLEICIIFTSGVAYFVYKRTVTKIIILPPSPIEKHIDQMESKPLFSLINKKKSIKIDDEPLCLPIRISNPKIDTSIQISSSNAPIYHEKMSQNMTLKPFSEASTKDLSSILPDLALEIKSEKAKRKEKYEALSKSFKSNNSDEIVIKYTNAINHVYEGVMRYFEQLSIISESAKIQAQSKSSSSNRIVVEPELEDYCKKIVERVENFNKKLKESESFTGEAQRNLKMFVSQITSDTNDVSALNSRVDASLENLQSLNKDDLEKALYVLCFRVVDLGSQNSDDVKIGCNFSYNFTKYIMTIAKSYPAIHNIYFYALIRIKYYFYPMIDNKDIENIYKRTQLLDICQDSNGRLSDNEKDRLKKSMDTGRSYGHLLGSLFVCEDSMFNEGDAWRWLAFVINLKIDYVDRVHMPMLYGYLKVTGGALKRRYREQFDKLVRFLKDHYVEFIEKKFGSNPYLKAYVTQLRQVITELV
ncbi:hypothetical protein SteCoe_23219 [Stentor coeruleus]|uniref:Nucleoporin GLE1 n=1 Tax=Stentor coeruleus TaxID=5963 RepID=A0A1R2BKT2_9CILI|nr:hypothetical protein SteCoe_23219 [Stentor coeruleus]